MAAVPKQETVAARLGALEERYSHLDASINTLAHKVDRIAQRIEERSRTNWGVVATAVGVGVALVASLMNLGASGPLRELARHDQQIAEATRRINAITESRFNRNDAKRQHDELAKMVEKLDESLQREMRDLDRVSESRIDALDTVLQREVRLLVDPIKSEIGEIRKRVESLEKSGK